MYTVLGILVLRCDDCAGDIVYEAPACDRWGNRNKGGKKEREKRAGNIVDLRLVAGDTWTHVYSNYF